MLEIFTGFWPKSASEPKTEFLNFLYDSVQQPEFLAYLSRMTINKDGIFAREDCGTNTALIQTQNIYNILNYIYIENIQNISPKHHTGGTQAKHHLQHIPTKYKSPHAMTC